MKRLGYVQGAFGASTLVFGYALLAPSSTSTTAPPGTVPYVLTVPPGFPPPPLPVDNPLTVQGVNLGKRLFNDVRLSGDNTKSCASCHESPAAFSNSPHALSVGITDVQGTRNTPALFNLVYQKLYFWDGRAPSLRLQALAPIQNPIEMNQPLSGALAKLMADSTYQSQFSQAFGSPGINADRLGKALEQYEITILSTNSKFDDFRRGLVQLTPQEMQGFNVFRTPFNPQLGQFGGDCARCHGGPLFSDFQFRNNGLDAKPVDPGREDVTGLASDLSKFKTPSLRNVAVSGPYMHDGRFLTLAEVVAHYSNGIQPSATLDPGLAHEHGGVNLSTSDQAALVAFLKTLTDPQFVGISITP